MSRLRISARPSALPLEKVLRRVNEISSIPQVALKVMEVAADPHSGAADLKKVLETDAALSARVLRCVNSSAYALRGKVTNLQHAITYLGMKQIRNLAMTASVSEMFKKDEPIGTYRRSGLWRHLVSVGICARLIGMRLGLMEFEDMFLAGLLHDVGIILEDQHAHEAFCQAVCALREESTLQEAEFEHLGFDHTSLGGQVAEAWGFPAAIKAAVRYHHRSIHYQGDEAQMVQCVEAADILCTLKGISSVGMKLALGSTPPFAALGLKKDDIVVLAADLDQEFSAHQDLFQM
jgi:HD-like signal output (HDOD) protein